MLLFASARTICAHSSSRIAVNGIPRALALSGAVGSKPLHDGLRFFSTTSGVPRKDILEGYTALCESGRVKEDRSQVAAARVLAEIQTQMKEMPLSVAEAEEHSNSSSVCGAYLWGPVGSGKSMIMDLFYNTASIPKRRVHFHEFMVGVHKRLHQIQESHKRTIRKSVDGLPVYQYTPTTSTHPMEIVADEITADVRLLCFDEMQVTDVADAMVLRQLFDELLKRNTFVAFTSNQPPDDLYQGGLSRKYFLPFVDILKARCEVLHIGEGVDYRTLSKTTKLQQLQTSAADSIENLDKMDTNVGGMFTGAQATQKMKDSFEARTGSKLFEELILDIEFGRTLKVRTGKGPGEACSSTAWVSFKELCSRASNGSALGPPDFLAIASRFPVVYMESVPQIQPSKRDDARRLVTLVDTLYEARTQLFVSTECPLDSVFALLFEADKQAKQIAMDAHTDAVQSDYRVMELSPEEKLMFARARSRLIEMVGDGKDTPL